MDRWFKGPDAVVPFGWEWTSLAAVIAFGFVFLYCWLAARHLVKREPFFWKDQWADHVWTSDEDQDSEEYCINCGIRRKKE